MSINYDISWDFHVQRLCQNMYYHLSLLRRLRSIFPRDFLQVHKSYIQPRLDYGINLYGCNTQKNIDLVQRVQNHAAMLITGNFDKINCRGPDLVKFLNLYTIVDRRYYFLTLLMFKAIHGIALNYLSGDTRGCDVELYLPTLRKEAIRNAKHSKARTSAEIRWYRGHVLSHNTLPHYHHYADLSEGIERLKCLLGTFCRVCV